MTNQVVQRLPTRHQQEYLTMTLRALANVNDARQLQKDEIVVMDLTDFDVQIGVTENRGIQIFEVTDIVTRWFNDVFGQCLQDTGYGVGEYAQFDTIILLQRSDRRLQEGSEEGMLPGGNFCAST